MKFWTVSSLFLCAGVLAGGCAGSSAPTDEGDPATAISQLPLSAKCASCAQGALAGKCAPELSACANTPSCFDVDACLGACDPKDVACFSGCAKASAQFNDLASCVFCDSCPAECSGEWKCDPKPQPQPSACDKQGDCAACAQCSIQKECSKELAACNASPDCSSLAQCVLACGADTKCVAQCEAQVVVKVPEFGALEECVACKSCPLDCNAPAQGCASSPAVCDGSGDCNACLQCAEKSACAKELEECMKSDECASAIGCVEKCGPSPDCANQCLQSFPNASAALQALGSCAVCDQCPADCNAKAWGCAP